MADRPNFLFFITDQLRADHLGCYGNRIIRTPTIDSLAARGTAFDRFYVASPVCQPNRATNMTGLPTVVEKPKLPDGYQPPPAGFDEAEKDDYAGEAYEQENGRAWDKNP